MTIDCWKKAGGTVEASAVIDSGSPAQSFQSDYGRIISIKAASESGTVFVEPDPDSRGPKSANGCSTALVIESTKHRCAERRKQFSRRANVCTANLFAGLPPGDWTYV